MKLKNLKPAEYNPRVITSSARDGLKASLEKFGNVQQIVWNKKTKNVVGGHQRLDILLELGHEEAEVAVVDLTEQEEKALNIALNNPEIQGGWDREKLDIVLEELKIVIPEFQELKFDELEMGEIVTGSPADEWEDMPEFEQEDKTKFSSVIVNFPTELDMIKFANLLQQKVTDKTKSIYFPEQKREGVLDISYEDSENEP